MLCAVLQELQDIVHKLLWAYQQSNQGALPRRLIFYRDGVSDGQFNAVQHAEVAMIMQACRMVKTKTGKPYSPPVSSALLPTIDVRTRCADEVNVLQQCWTLQQSFWE